MMHERHALVVRRVWPRRRLPRCRRRAAAGVGAAGCGRERGRRVELDGRVHALRRVLDWWPGQEAAVGG